MHSSIERLPLPTLDAMTEAQRCLGAVRPSIIHVDFSDDGGRNWAEVELDAAVSPYAWHGWRHDWKAEPGEHELCVRATDSEGNVQPDAQAWNLEGVQNNAVQRVRVIANPVEQVQAPADE